MKRKIIVGVSGLVLALVIGYTLLSPVREPDSRTGPEQLTADVTTPLETDNVLAGEPDLSGRIEDRREAVASDGDLRTIQVADRDSELPLPDVLVDFTMETGQSGPKFETDAQGRVSIPKATLLDWELVRLDKPGYFLGVLDTKDLAGTVLLERNQQVQGLLLNTPSDLRRTHRLQLWLNYRFLAGTKWQTIFANSDRNKRLRQTALDGDRILIDPAFNEDAQLSLVAFPRNGFGWESIKKVPLPKGQHWVEIDLSGVSVKEKTSSLEVTIRFEGPSPVGEFRFELEDEKTGAFFFNDFDGSRSANERFVVASFPSLKPGNYTSELTFHSPYFRFLFPPIEVDGPTATELVLKAGAKIGAVLDVDLVPEVDFSSSPVTLYVYDTRGNIVRSSTLRSREQNSIVLETIQPGELTLWAQARNQGMISNMVTISPRDGDHVQLSFQLVPAQRLELVSAIESPEGNLKRLEIRSDNGAVFKGRIDLGNERRTRLLHPGIYTVVCELEDREFRERVDLRNDDAQVVIR